MIRSSTIILDEALCAAQGYLAAVGLNKYAGTQYNPQTVAIGAAGVAFLDKLIYQISSKVIPGPYATIGPIPVGPKNFVSFGLALYTTAKVMQVAGLILAVPKAISSLGLACGIALAAGALYTSLQKPSLEEHIASTSFANRVYDFKDGDQEHKVRIVCNPEGKKITWSPGGMGKMSSSDHYILFANTSIPDSVKDQLKLEGSVGVFTGKINGAFALDYSAKVNISS